MMVQWFKNLAQNIGSDEIISTEGALGEGLPKKVAVPLDFVQLRGGGPCPNFLSTFHKLYILGQFAFEQLFFSGNLPLVAKETCLILLNYWSPSDKRDR